MARRRIFDPTEGGAPKPICSRCGESISWATATDLRRVHIEFRCLPGRHPQASELRCRFCNTRIVVIGRPPDLKMLSDQAGALASLDMHERTLIEAKTQNEVQRRAHARGKAC